MVTGKKCKYIFVFYKINSARQGLPCRADFISFIPYLSIHFYNMEYLYFWELKTWDTCLGLARSQNVCSGRYSFIKSKIVTNFLQFILENTKVYLHFLLFGTKNKNGAGNWNLFSWKMSTCLSCVVNGTATDDLEGYLRKGTMASAAMVLICLLLLYPPLQRSWKGGILVSPCPIKDNNCKKLTT